MIDAEIKNLPELINIKNAVSRLIMPNLQPLHNVLLSLKEGIEAEKRFLLQRKEQVRSDAYGAAARLMLLGRKPPKPKGGNYLNNSDIH